MAFLNPGDVRNEAPTVANPTVIPVNPYGFTFVFVQSSPTTVWTIVHNMKKLPSVYTEDLNEDETFGAIHFIDDNSISVTFALPVAGRAFLN
jgi:hypothetical protein